MDRNARAQMAQRQKADRAARARAETDEAFGTNPIVQAIALIIACAYVVINLVADVVTFLLTPKLRTAL